MPRRRKLIPRVSSRRGLRKSHDGGVRFRVSPHPNSFNAVPWFPLVVRLTNPPASVTTVTLAAAISNQLGVTFTGGQVNVRLQSLKVWGSLTTTPLGPLAVTVMDPIATIQASTSVLPSRVLEVLQDFPDLVSRACVGYKYPKAQREASLFASNLNPTVLLAMTGVGPDSVIYFYLQWRPANTTFPPILLEEEDNEDEDFVDLHKLLRSRLCIDDNGRISNEYNQHVLKTPTTIHK